MNEEQRTEEWFKLKMGKLSASNMSAALHITKDGSDYADRLNLKIQILSERLTGQTANNFVTAAMQHGIDQEPIVKDILRRSGMEIIDTGFIHHPFIEDFGASPDGLIGLDGLIEIKCPTTQTHIKWLIDGVIPEEHKPQMIAQIACTGRKWVDFISFDPRMINTNMRIFRRKFIPTKEEISIIEKAAFKFMEEVYNNEQLLNDAYFYV